MSHLAVSSVMELEYEVDWKMLSKSTVCQPVVGQPGYKVTMHPIFARRAIAILSCATALAAMAWHVWMGSREEEQMQMAYSMHQILVGLQEYNDSNDRVPRTQFRDTSRAERSWRVELLPYLQSGPFERGDLSWRNPVYCLDHSTGVQTNVVAITGPGTVFEGTGTVSLDDVAPDTIVLLEVDKSGIPWADAGDITVGQLERMAKAGQTIHGVAQRGFHVAFSDGSVWLLRNGTRLANVLKLCRVTDAKQYDREELLATDTLDRFP